MKFDVMPIINEMPTSVKPFRSLYDDRLTAELAYKKSKWAYTRTRLAEAQNWKCCFCGCYMTEIHGKKNSVTVEHVIPKSLGGDDHKDNLAASCSRCNNRRGTKDAYEFRSSDVNEKSKARIRLDAKIRKYVKKAHKLADQNFKVNEKIQTFEDWFSTLSLCHRGKELFFAEYNLS